MMHTGEAMKEKSSVQKESRYAVAFRAHEQRKAGCPHAQWIEVTVVAPTREKAVNRAKEIVRPVRGLIYEGTS